LDNPLDIPSLNSTGTGFVGGTSLTPNFSIGDALQQFDEEVNNIVNPFASLQQTTIPSGSLPQPQFQVIDNSVAASLGDLSIGVSGGGNTIAQVLKSISFGVGFSVPLPVDPSSLGPDLTSVASYLLPAGEPGQITFEGANGTPVSTTVDFPGSSSGEPPP